MCCSTDYLCLICCKSTAFVYLCMFTTVRVCMRARVLAFLCVCDCVCVCICLSVRLCVSASVSCATKSQNIVLPPTPSPLSSILSAPSNAGGCISCHLQPTRGNLRENRSRTMTVNQNQQKKNLTQKIFDTFNVYEYIYLIIL